MKKDTIEFVIEKTAELLATVGVKVEDENVNKQLAEKGFDVDQTTGVVKIPTPLLESLLSTVPKTIRLYHRDLERYVEFGGDKTYFSPSGFGPAVKDRATGERRPSTEKDVEEFAMVQHHLPSLDVASLTITATDLTEDAVDVAEFYHLLRCTDKPFIYKAVYEDSTDKLMEMAGLVVGGVEKLREKPTFTSLFCPTSPLLFTGVTIRSMLKLASYGIPVLNLTMTLGGVTAPVTVLGQIVQTNAEIISGIAIVQALYPGHPMFYGSSSTAMDMRTVVLSLGTPERPLIAEACALLAKTYGIPSIISGISSDSKSYDEQCAFEKALTMMPLINKASLIFGMGGFDSSNTYSLPQLVIDNEFVSAARHYYEFDYGNTVEEEMAILRKDGAGTNFLKEKQTFTRCKNYWRSNLFTRGPYERWERKNETLEKLAIAECEALLAKGIPPMEPVVADQLRKLYEESTKR